MPVGHDLTEEGSDDVAYADIGEVRLFFTDEGEGDPPILMVHGFSCDGHDWMWQIPTSRHAIA